MIVFAILIFAAFLTTIVPVINRLRKRNIYSTVKVSSDSIPCEKGDFNGRRLVKQSWRNFQRWVSLRSIQHFQFGQKFTRGGTLKLRDNSESNLILKLWVASRKHCTRVLNQDSWYKYGLNFTISCFIEDYPVLNQNDTFKSFLILDKTSSIWQLFPQNFGAESNCFKLNLFL